MRVKVSPPQSIYHHTTQTNPFMTILLHHHSYGHRVTQPLCHTATKQSLCCTSSSSNTRCFAHSAGQSCLHCCQLSIVNIRPQLTMRCQLHVPVESPCRQVMPSHKRTSTCFCSGPKYQCLLSATITSLPGTHSNPCCRKRSCCRTPVVHSPIHVGIANILAAVANQQLLCWVMPTHHHAAAAR